MSKQNTLAAKKSWGCPSLFSNQIWKDNSPKEKAFWKHIANYQSNIQHYLDDIPGLKLRLGRQPMEALKEAPSCKPAEGLKKAPKAPLESSYLGEETLSEARL